MRYLQRSLAILAVLSLLLEICTGAYLGLSKRTDDTDAAGRVIRITRFYPPLLAIAFTPAGWVESNLRGVPVEMGWDLSDHAFQRLIGICPMPAGRINSKP